MSGTIHERPVNGRERLPEASPGQSLASLLKAVPHQKVKGDSSVQVSGICVDSRSVRKGDVFVALRGVHVDGHRFIAAAVSAGASAVLCEEMPPEMDTETFPVPFIIVRDSLQSMGHLAATLYGNPSENLVFIGVTGSNGKTTTTYLIERILLDAGYPTGAVTTIEDRWPGHREPARFTTPQSHEYQRMLAEMVREGATHVVSEVSSHALSLHRMVGIRVRVAVFTNLSFEHREFHPDEEHYYQAKKRLFTEHLASGAGAVINMDDEAGRRLASELNTSHLRVIRYGRGNDAEVRAREIELSAKGATFDIVSPAGRKTIQSPLLGDFNVSNVLAATAVALELEIPLESIARSIEGFEGVPGRLETIDEGQDFTVAVDYAHSPDALENVLRTIRGLAPARVITLMGCGGDRSPEKRAPMGRIAAELSDLVVVTADNSRSEKTRDIIEDIQEGMKGHESKILVEEDRAAAILQAIRCARTADFVLLSGKGHEATQTEGGVTRPFDDRIQSREALRKVLGKAVSQGFEPCVP